MGIFDWDNYKNGPSSDGANALAAINPIGWGGALWNAATGESGWSGSIKGTAALGALAYGGGSMIGGFSGSGAAAGASGTGAAASGAAGGAAGGSSMSWLAPLVGGGMSAFGQYQANQQNAQIADKQMQFQANMSNTAHQREVNDLKAAGLNPILSANAGASTPTGAGAVMENTLAASAQSAKDMVQMKMQQEMQQAQMAQIAAGIDSTMATTRNTNMDTAKKAQEIRTMGKDAVQGDIWQGVQKWFMQRQREANQSGARWRDDMKINDSNKDEIRRSLQFGRP